MTAKSPEPATPAVIPAPKTSADNPSPATAAPAPLTQAVRERLAYATREVGFAPASATIREDSYDILNDVANLLLQHPGYNLTISGHTDDRGSDVANLNLSRRRAAACRNFIVDAGVSPERISSAGFGEVRPLTGNDTVEGRRRNRRVEFRLVPR